MSRFALLCVITLCVLFYRCSSPDYLSEHELSSYILKENTGLSKSINVNDIQIKITYRPTDLLVAQELKGKEDPTASEVQKFRNKYANHYYFIISLSNADKEILNAPSTGMADFSKMLQTFSFGMTEVVNLTTKQDTIAVADYIYNRTFGMSNSTDLLFVFDKAKAVGTEWLDININEFGLGIGKQSLRFEVKDIENAPKIFKI